MKNELYLRVRELEEFARFLSRFKGEMEYHRLPLVELCVRIAEKENGVLYQMLEKTVSRVRESYGIAFSKVWKQCFDEYKDKLHISKEEQSWIRDCFSYSHVSLEAQVNELEYYIGQTNKKISELQNEIQGRGKVYITFGVMSGILLLILFS